MAMRSFIGFIIKECESEGNDSRYEMKKLDAENKCPVDVVGLNPMHIERTLQPDVWR